MNSSIYGGGQKKCLWFSIKLTFDLYFFYNISFQIDREIYGMEDDEGLSVIQQLAADIDMTNKGEKKVSLPVSVFLLVWQIIKKKMCICHV